MSEYLTTLLLITIVLITIFHLVKNRIPLSPRTIYCTVGISYALGAIFPIATSNLNMGRVLVIYFGLIAFSAIVLSNADSRFSLKISPAPQKEAGLEKKYIPVEPAGDPPAAMLPGETVVPEVCATLDTPSKTGFSGEEREESRDFESYLLEYLEEKPAAGETAALHDLITALEKVEKELAPEEELSIDTEISVEETAPTKVKPLLKPALSEQSDIAIIAEMPANGEQPAVFDVQPAVGEEERVEIHKEPLAVNEILPAVEEIAGPGPAALQTEPDSVNKYISAGFECKARGDMAGALDYFLRALHLNQGEQISAALALEICAAYQEMGQYLQAGMILKSVLEQKGFILDHSLRQKLQGQLFFLDVLAELLEAAKMLYSPYSKIPSLIKVKANLETAERLKQFNRGGRVSEKQQADFGATGS